MLIVTICGDWCCGLAFDLMVGRCWGGYSGGSWLFLVGLRFCVLDWLFRIGVGFVSFLVWGCFAAMLLFGFVVFAAGGGLWCCLRVYVTGDGVVGGWVRGGCGGVCLVWCGYDSVWVDCLVVDWWLV